MTNTTTPSGPEKAIPVFLDAIAETSRLWTSVDIRVVALKVEDTWHNLMTRCTLDSRVAAQVPLAAFPGDTASLACRQEIVPVSQLPQLIQDVRQGALTVAGLRIAFLSTDQQTPYRDAYGRIPGNIDGAPEEPYRVGHLLRVTGDSGDRLFQRSGWSPETISTAFQTAPNPWVSLDDVTRYALRSQEKIGYHILLMADFVAPFEARFTRTTLERGVVRYQVRATSSLALEQCSVGIFGRRQDGSIVSETLQSTAADREADATGITLSGTRDFGSLPWAVLFLRFGSSVAARAELEDPAAKGENPRLAAYTVFDPELVWLTHLLSQPQHRDKNQFHQAVARLFALAGCAVDSFVTDTKLSGPGLVDFLAHAVRERTMFVVECTLGPLSSAGGKPTRLASRAQDVQSTLAPLGQEVVAVIATAKDVLPPSELEAAATDGIAVLGRSQLLSSIAACAVQRTFGECLRVAEAASSARDFPFVVASTDVFSIA